MMIAFDWMDMGWKIQHAFKWDTFSHVMLISEKSPNWTHMKMTWSSFELLAVYPKVFAMALQKSLENDSDEI